MSNYYNDGVNAVAFSRGNRGFFAMAKNGQMDVTLQTGNKNQIVIPLNVFSLHLYFFL